MREACGRWLEETQRAIPAIVFVVKDGAGGDVRPVTIRVDGAIAAERYDGTALALDPGEHTFRFEAPGHASLEKTFRLAQGERERQETITLESPRPAPSAAPVDEGEPRAAPSALRTAGLVVGVAGLAGIATGSALGLVAIVKNDQAHCDAKNVCGDPQARRDAQGWAAGSTIAFVAGAALVVSGGAMFFLAPRHAANAPSVAFFPTVSTQSAGAALGGTW